MNVTSISRRNLLAAVAACIAIGACSDNPATGRSQFVLISDEELAALGREAWRDALQRLPRATDTAMQRRIARIGQNVAALSGARATDWEFVVFDSPEINAFVLPGGKVGFFRGLIEQARSDDEIAAVMGHEIGHVKARHAAERMSQQVALDIGVSLTAAALSEEYGRHAQSIAGALGAGALYGIILPYSRMQELEADRLGVLLTIVDRLVEHRLAAKAAGKAAPAGSAERHAHEAMSAAIKLVVNSAGVGTLTIAGIS